MKKVLAVLLAVCMVALFGTAVMADGQIGFDYVVSGSGQIAINGSTLKPALTGYSLNGEYLFSKYKVGFDYGIFSYKDSALDVKFDNQTEDFIGGYKLVDGDTSIYLIMDYYSGSLTDKSNIFTPGDKINSSALLVGLETSSKISDKLSLDSSVAYSMFGANISVSGADSQAYDFSDESVLKCGIKLNYQVTKGLNVNLGWKHLIEQASTKVLAFVTPGGKAYSLSSNIFTVGTTYKF